MRRIKTNNPLLSFEHVLRLNDYEYEVFEAYHKKYIEKFNQNLPTHYKPSRPFFIRQSIHYFYSFGQHKAIYNYAPIESYAQRRNHVVWFKLTEDEENDFANMLIKPLHLSIKDLVMFAVKSFASNDFIMPSLGDELDELDKF